MNVGTHFCLSFTQRNDPNKKEKDNLIIKTRNLQNLFDYFGLFVFIHHAWYNKT